MIWNLPIPAEADLEEAAYHASLLGVKLADAAHNDPESWESAQGDLNAIAECLGIVLSTKPAKETAR